MINSTALFSFQISDAIRGDKKSDVEHQTSMEYSLLITTFICVLGGLAFILCAFYLEKDRTEADKYNQTDDTSSLLNSVSGDQDGDDVDDDDELIDDDDDDEKLIRDPSIPNDEHLTVIPGNTPQLV